MNKWDARFLELARLVATWSKDPSTKCGAVVVRPDNTICSTGYNGFARGMDDSMLAEADRETRLRRTVHAEANAVLAAPEPVRGYTLYTSLSPCSACAVLVIQAGIRRVVAPRPSPEHEARWNFDWTRDVFREAGVVFQELTARCEPDCNCPYCADCSCWRCREFKENTT